MQVVSNTIGESKLKPFQFYLGYNENVGLVVLGNLGYFSITGAVQSLLYPFAYMKGLVKAKNKKRTYLIDEEYLNATIKQDIEYTLTHEFEYELSSLSTAYRILDYKLPEYIDLSSDVVKTWYLKNKLTKKDLPDLLYTFEKQKITKKTLEIGNLYIDNDCNYVYCYIGKYNDLHYFVDIMGWINDYDVSNVRTVYEAFSKRIGRIVRNMNDLMVYQYGSYFKRVKTLPALFVPNTVEIGLNPNMKKLLSMGKLGV